METAMAILMVLGIFVDIPVVIGGAIAVGYFLGDRRVRKAQHAKALKEAVAETQEGTKELQRLA